MTKEKPEDIHVYTHTHLTTQEPSGAACSFPGLTHPFHQIPAVSLGSPATLSGTTERDSPLFSLSKLPSPSLTCFSNHTSRRSAQQCNDSQHLSGARDTTQPTGATCQSWCKGSMCSRTGLSAATQPQIGSSQP